MNDKKWQGEKLGIAGRLTELFLYNRTVAVLTVIVIVLWGMVSYILMPKLYNPEIVAPAFMIVTDYPNADSRDVYELVTRPMEDKISELIAIDSIASQSLSGGRSIVTVKFDIGSDQESAKVSLNQKLRDNMDLKPLGANDPSIRSIDPDDVPIIDIGITSDIFSESSLRKLAFDMADELKQIEGISKFEVVGGRKKQISVALHSAKLTSYNISAEEILSAIRLSNGIYTADMIRGGESNSIISISGNIVSEEEMRNLVVKEVKGTAIRLGEVADVSYDAGEITNYISLSDKEAGTRPVIHIALAKLKGVNATTTSQMVEKKLNELEDGLVPDGVRVKILRNEGEVARSEIGKLTFDLVKSIAIVAILLMVFLGIRNSMVAAISIPLVLLVVFGVGLMAGQTVNRITLFALILSLGLLVDDAIVVIENIARYFRLYPGEDKRVLIVRAVSEVGSALSLSTVTMALAFIPMAFVIGMMGPYMGPIPFFVPVALLASLALSVTINPFLALLFTKKESGHKPNIFLRSFHLLEKKYAFWLDYLLQEKKRYYLAIGGVTIAFFLSIILPLTPAVPFRMLPKADRDQFYVYVDLPSNANVEQTQKVTSDINVILLEDKDVLNVENFVGIASIEDFNGLFKGSSQRVNEFQSTLRINLVSHEKRQRKSEEIAQQFRQASITIKEKYPDVNIRIMEDPPGPPVLATFLLKIKGDDSRIREKIADDFLKIAQETKGISDIDVSSPEYALNYSYRINTDKAQQLAVSPVMIAKTLQTLLSGSVAGTYHSEKNGSVRQPEQEYILVRLAKKDREDPASLQSMFVTNSQGVQVPLTSLLERTDKSFDFPIVTDERRMTTYVSGEMVGRSVVYAVLDIFPELLSYRIPETESRLADWSLLSAQYEDVTTGQQYQVEIDGEWKLTLEVFRDLGIAMAGAIFMIYFVLAGKARSLSVPLLIMVSIPLGMIGVFPGFAMLFLIKGTYFNATSMIGIIALSGLSVKNAVIFLEYLEPLRSSGKSLREALVETGRIRLLPIVLTSLTAILGSLTIISDPVWEGLAWALVFGLTVSTMLTLVIFPLMYFGMMHKKWKK